MIRIIKQKLDTLKKIQYQKLLWSRSIDFNYYYDKLLEDCLKGKRFEFIDCYVDPKTGRIRAWINHNATKYDIFVKFDSINEIDPGMYPKDVRNFILNNIKEE